MSSEPTYGDFAERGLVTVILLPVIVLAGGLMLPFWLLGKLTHRLGWKVEHEDDYGW